ncbi:Glutamate receptor ionotropic, delta-1 [Portunus trituberculatus]|uniref:Glutamate receptor ionotropic, delta-1 n=1 Tax=Portunus trituberculatus TaxID=210409 RepID=A0A5B7HKX1_PORTR|nr:Glutamate receptor ionotropic, delta-1 [Portunus trituberculatus]
MVARSMLIVVVVAAAGSTAERWASSLLPESQKPDTQLALQTLEEVVTGPLAGRSLVLYLDPALGPQILQTIVALFTLPVILVNLGSEGELWSQEQPLAVLRAEYLIHMAVFISDPRPFFHSVIGTDNRWKPKYFLMFSVSKDPHGKVVKADYRFLLGTWFDDYPYLHQAKDKPEGEGDGVEVEILNALSSQLNFSFDLTTEPPDQLWGDFENGSWTGMLGMVYQGGKNFTVNYFGYTNKRIEDFDASVSYWMEGFGLALLKPKPLPKWRSVYYPFTPVVWASMAFSFSLATTIFYLQGLAGNQRRRELNHIHKCRHTLRKQGWSVSALAACFNPLSRLLGSFLPAQPAQVNTTEWTAGWMMS